MSDAAAVGWEPDGSAVARAAAGSHALGAHAALGPDAAGVELLVRLDLDPLPADFVPVGLVFLDPLGKQADPLHGHDLLAHDGALLVQDDLLLAFLDVAPDALVACDRDAF